MNDIHYYIWWEIFFSSSDTDPETLSQPVSILILYFFL